MCETNYETLCAFARAFRTDNEKVFIAFRVGSGGAQRGAPMGGTAAQVRKKLLQNVGEQFDEWMAMEAPEPIEYRGENFGPIVDPTEKTEGADYHEEHRKICDEQDDARFGLAEDPTDTRTEPSPTTPGETDQSGDEELVGD